MGRCIVKLKGHYIGWTTVADGATTPMLTRDEMREHLLWSPKTLMTSAAGTHREGLARIELEHQEKMVELSLERADENGTSWRGQNESAEDCVGHNRMGPRESCLSIKNVIKKCLADREEWGLPPLTEEIEGS